MDRNDYIKNMINACKNHIEELKNMQAINPESSYCKHEIEKYKIKLACFERALPKVPIKEKDYKCPNCHKKLEYHYEYGIGYCGNCGQTVNWKGV